MVSPPHRESSYCISFSFSFRHCWTYSKQHEDAPRRLVLPGFTGHLVVPSIGFSSVELARVLLCLHIMKPDRTLSRLLAPGSCPPRQECEASNMSKLMHHAAIAMWPLEDRFSSSSRLTKVGRPGADAVKGTWKIRYPK